MIENMNIENDITILSNELGKLFDNKMVLTLRITSYWLKIGVKNGLNLHQLANLYVSKNINETSPFSKIIENVKKIIGNMYIDIEKTYNLFVNELSFYLQSILIE